MKLDQKISRIKSNALIQQEFQINEFTNIIFFIIKTLFRLCCKEKSRMANINCVLNYVDFYNAAQSRQSNFIATFLQNMPSLKSSVKLDYLTDVVTKVG